MILWLLLTQKNAQQQQPFLKTNSELFHKQLSTFRAKSSFTSASRRLRWRAPPPVLPTFKGIQRGIKDNLIEFGNMSVTFGEH